MIVILASLCYLPLNCVHSFMMGILIKLVKRFVLIFVVENNAVRQKGT